MDSFPPSFQACNYLYNPHPDDAEVNAALRAVRPKICAVVDQAHKSGWRSAIFIVFKDGSVSPCISLTVAIPRAADQGNLPAMLEPGRHAFLLDRIARELHARFGKRFKIPAKFQGVGRYEFVPYNPNMHHENPRCEFCVEFADHW